MLSILFPITLLQKGLRKQGLKHENIWNFWSINLKLQKWSKKTRIETNPPPSLPAYPTMLHKGLRKQGLKPTYHLIVVYMVDSCKSGLRKQGLKLVSCDHTIVS